MAEPQSFLGLESLLFEAPLYAVFRVPEGGWWKGENAEGHCPFCKRQATFKIVWKEGDPLKDAPYVDKGADADPVGCEAARSITQQDQFEHKGTAHCEQ